MVGTRAGRRSRRWRIQAGPALLVAAIAAAGASWDCGFDEPPRFDGAGYAMLARALLDGRGYRAVDHPDAPPHHHFPPGYPIALASAWTLAGRSAAVAHGVSVACTAGAAASAYLWYRRQYRRGVALLLGLALAMNWAWHRVGGAIRSEPPYLLLSQVVLLAGLSAARSGGMGRGGSLGALMGAMTLTRHVGVAVAAAVGAELALRRRWRALAAAVAVAAAMIAPWAWRMATTPDDSQLGLLPPGRSLPEVVAGNAWFYAMRIPDALTGPVVEVGTVFAPRAYAMAAVFALIVCLVIARGVVRTLGDRRRRLAGLVICGNLALLLAWPFTEAGRFLVPLVPALLVAATEGGSVLARMLGRSRPRTWAAAGLLLAALPYSLYAAASSRAEAERRSHREVDAALSWIARSADRPGPLLTAYPAEAYWFTGRPGLAPPGDSVAIARAIDRYAVSYLVVVEARFARAQGDPLSRFVAERPDRVRLVWEGGSGAVAVYEVVGPE